MSPAPERLFLLCLLLSMTTTALAAADDRIESGNVIRNGSFEQLDAQGVPAHWVWRGAPGMTWAIDKDVVHDGRQSLRVSGEGVTEDFGSFHLRDLVPLRANRVYELSLWIKAKGVRFSSYMGLDTGIIFQSMAAEGAQRVGGLTLYVNNGTYDWTRVSERISTHAPIGLRTRPWRAVQDGTCWIDDVRLREVDVVPTLPSVEVPELIEHYRNALRRGDLAVLFAPPTRKILREMVPDEKVFTDGAAASISLARNEHEGIQVVLAPLWPGDHAKRVDVTVSALRDRMTGKPVAGGVVTWHPVGYLGLAKNGRLIGTPWPDILLPARAFSARGQQLQPIWVDVYAGPQTPAGDYEVLVTVQPQGAEAVEARIDVHVYDFTVPVRQSLASAFGANLPGTRRMVYEHRLASRRLIGFLPIAGFHPAKPKKGQFGEFDDVIAPFETRLNEHLALGGTDFLLEMPNFSGAYSGGVFSPGGFSNHNVRYDEQEAAYIIRYYRRFAQWLRKRNLLQDAYVYIWDEPAEARFENIKAIRDLIREADPDIRCLVVTKLTRELVGHVDIWVAGTENWEENRELAAELVARGDEMWWYWAPQFSMDPVIDLLGVRLLPWMAWKHRINGLLKWATDHWRNGQWPLHRIGESTDCWWQTGLGSYQGKGSLALPPTGDLSRDEKGTVVVRRREALSTIRLEAIRDGLEDYEYFVLLRSALERAKARHADVPSGELIARSQKLLVLPPDIVTSTKEYTKDDRRVLQHRDRIARAIEALDQTE